MPDKPGKDLDEMVVSLGKPKRPRGHRAKNCGISMVEHGNTVCLKFHCVSKDEIILFKPVRGIHYCGHGRYMS